MEYAKSSSETAFGEGGVPAFTLVGGKSAGGEQGDGGHAERGSVGASTGGSVGVGGGGGGGFSSSRRLTPRSEMRQAMKGSSSARSNEAHSPPPLSSSRRRAASPGDWMTEVVDEGDMEGMLGHMSGKGVAHGDRIHGTPLSTEKAERTALSPGRDQQNLPGFDFVSSVPETPGSHRGVWMASANRSELFEDEEDEDGAGGGRKGKKKMDLHGVSALKGQAGWRKQLELSAAKATVVHVPTIQMADGRASPTLTVRSAQLPT